MPDEESPITLVRSLQRGLSVIKSFSYGDGAMSVSEIARRTGLSRATTRRLLLTLEDYGYVRAEDPGFALRPAVLELGAAYFSSQLPWQSAAPVMEQLGSSVQENCLAGVLEETSVICVARTSHRLVNVGVYVGRRLPAYTSSMGRVLLAALDGDVLDEYFSRATFTAITSTTLTDERQLRAELDQVRTQGWSLVEGEVEEGLIGIAVPVMNGRGSVVASLNISAHGARVTAQAAEEQFLPPLTAAAREISLLFEHAETTARSMTVEA